MNKPTLPLTESSWRDLLQERNIFCINPGIPELPHLVSSDGNHMPGSFVGEYVWESPELFTELCGYLVRNYQEIIPYDRIDRVVGIGENASILAYKISESLSLWEKRDCLATFCTEKEMRRVSLTYDRYAHHERSMVFPVLPVERGERVLMVTNSLHTGYRIPYVVKAIENEGGIVFPYVITLWNGTGEKKLGDRTICALFSEKITKTSFNECPLCRIGSTPVPHTSFVKAWRASRVSPNRVATM